MADFCLQRVSPGGIDELVWELAEGVNSKLSPTISHGIISYFFITFAITGILISFYVLPFFHYVGCCWIAVKYMEISDFKCFKHCVKEVVAVVILSVGRDFMVRGYYL